MDDRTVTRPGLFLALIAFLVAGCANPNSVPVHSATEDKAINELKNMSPQQQIDRIQNGPMPASAKAAMIKKIKDKAGIP
ncbi:MAG: hypothetical protein P4L46_07040 [Fimbriimonas sp.]|nr:hypothetical protein [Fimbriimonas sp.]